jgi:hypothetical protein
MVRFVNDLSDVLITLLNNNFPFLQLVLVSVVSDFAAEVEELFKESVGFRDLRGVDKSKYC